MKFALSIAAALSLFASAGCVGPANPSFDVPMPEAEQALRELAERPARLDRPLVILGGWADERKAVDAMTAAFVPLLGPDEQMLGVSFADCGSFEAAREKLLGSVAATFGAQTPVDVVAFSMGGLVARAAAKEHPDGRRLRLVRLFTISTPHRGAKLADVFGFGPLERGMRSNSQFLAGLNGAGAAASALEYELQSYVLRDDWVVGDVNAAPPGATPWWLPPQPWTDTHNAAFGDPRILADIALRLRHEPPLSHPPPAPLP